MDEYLQPMARRAYGLHMLETPERNARLLLAYLRVTQMKQFNKRDLMRTPHKSNLPSMRDAASFDEAIALLRDGKWVFKIPSDHTGRQREDYAVNARLFMP